MNDTPTPIDTLIRKGVCVVNPASTHVDASVDPGRIGADVTLYGGCRISGETTSIGPGCVLGEEGPVILDSCQLAEDVSLKAGFFCRTTALSGVRIGAGAHVRPGTLLEEQVECGHTVGLKQTILLPYVITGSLVNLCDCLMAGGTDRRNHSEVGSSYVHFNYTPHQDKATASLLGDVPRGVMLDQTPIFLGGQGGLVGPVRIEYGTVIAAGTIRRNDVLEPNRLIAEGSQARESSYNPGIYGNISRVLINNFTYLGNLHAMQRWYESVRALFVEGSAHRQACHTGAQQRLREAIDERMKRLAQLADNLGRSLELAEAKYGTELPNMPFDMHRKFGDQWPELAEKLAAREQANDGLENRQTLLDEIEVLAQDHTYLEAIRALSPAAKQAGTRWLQAIVDCTVTLWKE